MPKTPDYNIEIRRRISEEYILVGKQIEALKAEENYLMCKQIHPDTISHMEYLSNESRLDRIAEDIVMLEHSRQVWDRAREICMEVIDEVGV